VNYVILEKSRVKAHVRTRKGKLERVKEFERKGELRRIEVRVLGKPPSGENWVGMWVGSGRKQEYKHVPMVDREEVIKLASAAKKMLAIAPLMIQGGLSLDFRTDHSGEALVGKHLGYEIGLKGKTFSEALGVLAHEIGHMCQKSRPGGMSSPDFGKRRVLHEKKAWNIGISLLKKIGYKLSDEDKHMIKQTMVGALQAYKDYWEDKYGQYGTYERYH